MVYNVVFGGKKRARGRCDLPTKQVTWNMLRGDNWSWLSTKLGINSRSLCTLLQGHLGSLTLF